MAAVVQPAEPVSDLRQTTKADVQIKSADSAEVTNGPDGNSSDGSGDVPGDTSDLCKQNGLHDGGLDPAMYYAANGYASHAYVYECPQGYEPSPAEWEQYNRYLEGVEGASPVYGENGSVYVHGYGYTSQPAYTPYTGAIPAIGADGQLYGPQAYQYPSHIYPHPVSPGGEYLHSPPVMTEVASGVGEPGPPGIDGSNPALANGNGASMNHRPGYPVTMLQPHAPYARGVLPMTMHTRGHHDPRAYDNNRGNNSSWADVTKVVEGQQRSSNPIQAHGGGMQSLSAPQQPSCQNGRPSSAVQIQIQAPQQPQRAPTSSASSSLGPGALARGYPLLGRSMSTPNGAGRAGRGIGGGGLEPRSNGRSWQGSEKGGKPRVRINGPVGNGNGNLDILSEQNRGPRTARIKNQRVAPGALRHTRGQGGGLNGNSEALSSLTNRDQYNRPDFVTKYECARFFVIKSFSEDDVHKSIKYNVWASTATGNKRLELAYQEAQAGCGGKAGGCPVFFFFSVNASGQFCGVAEMVGAVDFNKSVDFWQQDKWNGRLNVKWHIIKDIPNCQFRHIILENNDNKPVTNSRDTQEINFDQGLEMLNIFKNYASKTSILDDFQYYENRQRTMQEKRARQLSQHHRDQRQQVGGLQPVSEPESRHDELTPKLKLVEKIVTEVADENGNAKPRTSDKADLSASRYPSSQGETSELTSQRLGQLRLSDATEDPSAPDADVKSADGKATVDDEETIAIEDAGPTDKNSLMKQEKS